MMKNELNELFERLQRGKSNVFAIAGGMEAPVLIYRNAKRPIMELRISVCHQDQKFEFQTFTDNAPGFSCPFSVIFEESKDEWQNDKITFALLDTEEKLLTASWEGATGFVAVFAESVPGGNRALAVSFVALGNDGARESGMVTTTDLEAVQFVRCLARGKEV